MFSKVLQVTKITVVVLALLIVGFRLWRQHRLALWEERKVELLELARKAEPIIAALETYRKEHGRYPERLEQLVPRYLPHMPEPPWTLARVCWLGGISNWRYDTGQNIPSECRAVNQPYELSIRVRNDFCPLCFWSFGHALVYHPTGIYPQRGHGDYGGRLERIGRWGFYHFEDYG